MSVVTSGSTSSSSSSAGRSRGYTTVSGAAAAASAANQEESRPTSALMKSIFSPPLTLSQTAVAEAGASALSSFGVPPAYDAVFLNQPDSQSVVVHSWGSSHKDEGFQAVVILHSKVADVPAHLGINAPASSNRTSSSSSPSSPMVEEMAFLMTAPRNQPFILYSEAPKVLAMQVSVTEYLTLLAFFAKEWPRIRSKLLKQASIMQEGTDPVPLTNRLVFYSHGTSHYSVSLSSRLVLRAKADSRKSSENDQCLRAWLELRLTSGSGGSTGQQDFNLPLPALTTLSQDAGAVKSLTDWVVAYKNRSRKRSKPVA